MATVSDIQNSCLLILSTIRSSNLNYSIQETPYSIFLTLRKSHTKSKNISTESQSSLEQFAPETTEILNIQKEKDSLLKRCHFLENVNQDLKSNLEEATAQNELNLKTIGDLETIVETLHTKIDSTEKEVDHTIARKLKAVDDERRFLQNKHEKICVENRKCKNENEELNKEINSLKVSLKSSRKETKDVVNRYEKKTKECKIKISDLLDYKSLEKVNEVLIK